MKTKKSTKKIAQPKKEVKKIKSHFEEYQSSKSTDRKQEDYPEFYAMYGNGW